MSNGWTPERRLRQSQMIQQWKPWQFAGVKTAEGKNTSKMNAYKHGARCADVRKMGKQITNYKRILSQFIDNKF
jgi:hypothetical protein